MIGRWTVRGLCLTGRVRSVLRVCARAGLLIGRGGASGHGRPDVSDRSGCLLDSNWTLALWRPVRLAARPVADSLECCSGLTSASGRLRDQRVRSIQPARPVMLRAWVVYAPARPISLTSVSGQRDCSVFECLTTIFEGVRL
jgi:hypothetical protein